MKLKEKKNFYLRDKFKRKITPIKKNLKIRTNNLDL